MGREKLIKFRVNDEEYNDLLQMKETSKISSTSALIRDKVFNSTRKFSAVDKARVFGKLQSIRERHSANQSTQEDIKVIFEIMEEL